MRVKTCPCALAVRLDYSAHDPGQVAYALALIDKLGEFTTLHLGSRVFRVSRHCIALHGVSAQAIDSYGFDEVPDQSEETS